MSVLFDYPKKATFGRVIPKTKIYEHAKPSSALKELFIRQVDQIVWKYKLAPETINVPQTKSVPEIQIFTITLKDGELKEDVVRCIDKAIPFPIFFEITYDGKCKVVSCYKRPSEADSTKWVVSDYFESSWVTDNSTRKPLPITLDLGALYEELLLSLMPYPARDKEKLPDRVERLSRIRAREKELAKTEARLAKEKQFNRKVEINAEIRTMKQQLEQLMGITAGKKGK
ncbi:MAG: DUF4391 domain-containing protein [Nitrospirales bacterium]|nr:DUF4391 domain-containing protein [Nitrospirales bacterium]